MQLPRLTVQTTATVLSRGEMPFAVAAQRLMARFPIAETTLALPDFNVYALTLGRGRYVEGFARAFNVGPETFRTLAM
jgi:putative heme iron utilization protein